MSLDFGFQSLWCLLMVVKEETHIKVYSIHNPLKDESWSYIVNYILLMSLHNIICMKLLWHVKFETWRGYAVLRMSICRVLYLIPDVWEGETRVWLTRSSLQRECGQWPVSSLGHGAVAWTPATGPAPPHTRTQHCRSHVCHYCHGFIIHRM